MKKFVVFIILLYSFSVLSQEKTVIQLKVPNKDDVVYISGNQPALGSWDYDEIKMYKISDYYRMIALKLEYPAEFKFTRGSLDSEGIHKTLDDNPNFVIQDTVSKVAYRIKDWKDEMLKSQLNIGFQYLPFQSQILGEKRTVKIYLPKDYSESKKYPVLYLTEANAKKFKIVISSLESLSTAPYNAIPECILVGIPQDNIYTEINTNLESSAENFKNFILSELFNLINSKFNTSGFNGIIGHGMGADFNQMLMLSKNNPITAYINISLELNDNLKTGLADYFANHKGRKVHYYITNAKYNTPESIKSFRYLQNINQSGNNKNIEFLSQEFNLSKESLFSSSIKDGLLHIFKDYRNLDNYANFKDYADNYLTDMILAYRVDAELEAEDINYYASRIIDQKDVSAYQNMLKYIDSLSDKGLIQEKLRFTPIDKAIHYHKMEKYDTGLVYWNEALKAYDSDNSSVVDPRTFYYNFTVALDSYLGNNNPQGAIEFLEKCIEALPEYALAFHYFLAKIASEQNLSQIKGKASLMYCVENFKANIYFTKVDLRKLVYDSE
jgi:predicted alpha/beta superfamily hydrolase